MLRNCKANAVVFLIIIFYIEITKLKEDFTMKLPDKIIKLRKENGWSQEDFAEKLNVSRQAISRWENGTALPDAQNVLQISKLFNVTTDYLLNDDYESDSDIPVVKNATQETENAFSNKKRMHLASAICFMIAAFCLLMVIATGVNSNHIGISYFTLALCSANAVAQFILFFEKR